VVAGRNPTTDGIVPDRSGITTNSPSDRSDQWATKARRSSEAGAYSRARSGHPKGFGLAATRSIIAGYHGIKARIVSLATEAGRMAGLPIRKETCSNARPGSKRATFTECAASSASRSSLLWVHEDGVSCCCLSKGGWRCGVLDAWARRRVLAARSGIVTGIPWQSVAMVPFTMGAEKDGLPFDKGRMRGPQGSSQGIKHVPPWPTTGGESRHPHSSLHRGAGGCLGRPLRQRLCGFSR
jgi:hypothetical protein